MRHEQRLLSAKARRWGVDVEQFQQLLECADLDIYDVMKLQSGYKIPPTEVYELLCEIGFEAKYRPVCQKYAEQLEEIRLNKLESVNIERIARALQVTPQQFLKSFDEFDLTLDMVIAKLDEGVTGEALGSWMMENRLDYSKYSTPATEAIDNLIKQVSELTGLSYSALSINDEEDPWNDY